MFCCPAILSAFDFRAYQNRLGQAISTAIRNANVRYVVNLSSVGVHQPERTGVVLGLHDQEQRLNQLEGVNVLHLRPTFFMENFFGNIGVIKGMGVNGSPLAADKPFSFIATPDIGVVAARAAAQAGLHRQERAGQAPGPRDYTMRDARAPQHHPDHDRGLCADLCGGLQRRIALSARGGG